MTTQTVRYNPYLYGENIGSYLRESIIEHFSLKEIKLLSETKINKRTLNIITENAVKHSRKKINEILSLMDNIEKNNSYLFENKTGFDKAVNMLFEAAGSENPYMAHDVGTAADIDYNNQKFNGLGAGITGTIAGTVGGVGGAKAVRTAKAAGTAGKALGKEFVKGAGGALKHMSTTGQILNVGKNSGAMLKAGKTGLNATKTALKAGTGIVKGVKAGAGAAKATALAAGASTGPIGWVVDAAMIIGMPLLNAALCKRKGESMGDFWKRRAQNRKNYRQKGLIVDFDENGEPIYETDINTQKGNFWNRAWRGIKSGLSTIYDNFGFGVFPILGKLAGNEAPMSKELVAKLKDDCDRFTEAMVNGENYEPVYKTNPFIAEWYEENKEYIDQVLENDEGAQSTENIYISPDDIVGRINRLKNIKNTVRGVGAAIASN